MEVRNCSYQWFERILTKALIKGPRRLTLPNSTSLVYNIGKALGTATGGPQQHLSSVLTSFASPTPW